VGENLLRIEDLHVCFRTKNHTINAVNGVSFSLDKGEVLGIVGESGSGKSVTSLAIMRLIQCPPGEVNQGKIIFKGKNLLDLSEKEMRQVRGNKISMIFQEPMTSLNPVFTCGDQVAEAIMLHQGKNRKDAIKSTIELFKHVGISMPERRINEYPHQLSGGLRQRVMIAMGLSCNPELLIADEPTTALDVTIQAQILNLLRKIQNEFGMSIILITHDLGVIAGIASKVIVMYAGSIVEMGKVKEIYKDPLHPYTIGLLRSIPRINIQKKVLDTIEGQVPNPASLPSGCPFHPRCSKAMDICSKQKPPKLILSSNREVACWIHSYGEGSEIDG
jgi:oligopeptide/dipeptide ABC transporter ATP-binding protein